MQADAPAVHTVPKTLAGWTQLLCEQEMPIFSNTVQKINTTLRDEKKGALELASDILQDPNLTARLLKMSNSSYYNPSHQKISTISRAIVILGSKTIRELTLACSYFESILSTQNKEQANAEIGRAIHAAVQAKAIAIAANDPSPEEVFIAALLNNIGQLAFWCFSGQQGEQILALAQNNGLSIAAAEKQVLGFNLTDLGAALSRSWQLGGLIEQAISEPLATGKRVQMVQLSHQITAAVKTGWDSEALRDCIEKIAAITRQSSDHIKLQLQKNTRTAIKIAHQFGAQDASKYIQDAPGAQPFTPLDNDELPLPVNDRKQLQFQVLEEISTLLDGEINLNLLFETILEGIHRGVGMDRTLFALLSADKKTLKEKYSFGWLKEFYGKKTIFSLSAIPPNLFYQALQQDVGMWAQPATEADLFTPHVVNIIGRQECFLVPVLSDHKPIGLIYADRGIHQKPFVQEEFNNVRLFAQQANIGLKIYRLKHST